MIISAAYLTEFLDRVKFSNDVAATLNNHGYFRTFHGTNVAFYPNLTEKDDQHHTIGMTPGLNQTPEKINSDLTKGRILLVAEALNSSGAYVILEDDTGYMTLTGNMADDLLTYVRRVIKAIVNVTGAAESAGLSPHDYITRIDQP